MSHDVEIRYSLISLVQDKREEVPQQRRQHNGRAPLQLHRAASTPPWWPWLPHERPALCQWHAAAAQCAGDCSGTLSTCHSRSLKMGTLEPETMQKMQNLTRHRHKWCCKVLLCCGLSVAAVGVGSCGGARVAFCRASTEARCLLCNADNKIFHNHPVLYLQER
jgi:hypothetical protein